MNKMRVLITLGPTQEPIDEVRYITNASSGKMGLALAKESIRLGNETTIVAGPVELSLPKEAEVIRVKTAEEMIKESLKELKKGYDIFISAAAIADYTPEFHKGKIKSGSGYINLKLKENPKLTALARKKFPNLFIVAFKAEYGLTKKKLLDSASSKMNKEKLDLVVANDIKKTGFGKDKTEVYILNKKKGCVFIPIQTKDNIAKAIWSAIGKEIHNEEN